MPDLLGEGLSRSVLNQIRTRQTLQGGGVDSDRTPEEIKALIASNSFLRLASAVSIDKIKLNEMGLDIESNDGDGLARNNVLFQGTSTLKKTTSEVEYISWDGEDTVSLTENEISNESRSGFSPDGKGSYELSRDYGRVPMAGMTGANIKTLTRGSIKKATIEIKAHSREQFDIIDVLYMRLGMTVCLEWGNSLYPQLVNTPSEGGTTSGGEIHLKRMGDTYITNSDYGFFTSPSTNQFESLKQIDELRGLYASNYDAIIGRVTNFKWSYQEDGSYKITLTVISMGDIIESLKTNLSVDLTTEKFLELALTQLSDASPSDATSTTAKDINILTSFFWTWKFINKGFSPDQPSLYPKDEIVNWFEDGYSYRTQDLANLNGATKYHVGNYMKNSLPGQTPGETEVAVHTVQFYRIIALWEEDIIFDDRLHLPNYGPYNNGGLGNLSATHIVSGENFKLLGFSESGGSTTVDYTSGDQASNLTKTYSSAGWVQKYVKGKLDTNAASWMKYLDNETTGDDFFGEMTVNYTVTTKRAKLPTNLATLQVGDGVMLANSLGNPTSTSLENQNAAASNAAKDNPSDGPSYYIRFGAFLEFIKENVLPRIDEGHGENDHTQNPSIMDIDFNESTNIMYSLPNQLSLDPRVCIIRNDNFRSQQNKTWKYFTSFGGKGGLKIFSPKEGISINNGGEGENNYKNTAYIMNIYLNFNYCMEAIGESANEKGDVNLYSLLRKLTVGINKALGGINNLEPIVDETTNKIRIIESSQIPGFINESQLEIDLNIAGYLPKNETGSPPTETKTTSNFIRKVNIDTTISPALSSMIAIGATNSGYVKGTDATAFSKWNKGLTDRFKIQLVPGTVDSPPKKILFDGKEVELDEALNNYFVKYLSTDIQILGSSYGLSQRNLGYLSNYDSEIIERNISVVSEFYRYLLATRTKSSGGNGVCGGTLGFIPFKMNFSMDGMSGWKIYNSLKINARFLPPVYNKTLNFIITAIDHSIKVSDWETNVQVQVVPKSTQEHNSITDLEYEWGIAKAAKLNEAVDIVPRYKQSEELPDNPGETNDDPIGVESTSLGTSPSSETLSNKALKTDESIESVIKAGMDIIDSL